MEHEPQIQRIGRYEVVRKIATGGMAELFLARYVGPGGFEKRCALKRILPQFAADQTFTRMFLTEAKITAQLDHPNIVQIFELGQDDSGQYFIAMEMVNGVNLRQLLTMAQERGSSIPPELAAYIVTQALEGLAYAHELRSPSTGEPLHLVHRDISPQNILVSYEGAVKLVDFGIVKGASISGETQTGMLKGKVAYMSPEQATGERLDGRSDLFSLSVVLFELIAGSRPFSAVNELMTLKAILEEPPQPLISFAPECPEGIERAINRGLAKYPQERFTDARTFHMELDHVLRECPVPLGRHVVAEYIQSLTEGSTVSFDATRLRIPRRSPSAGFAHQIPSGPDPHRPWNGTMVTPSPVPPSPLTAGAQRPGDSLAANGAEGPSTDVDQAPLRLELPPAGPTVEDVAPNPRFAGAPRPAAYVRGATDALERAYGHPPAEAVSAASAVRSSSALDADDLAAAGVNQTRWWPLLALVVLFGTWGLIWAWQKADVAAVIVSPDEPPSRIEAAEEPAPLRAPPPDPVTHASAVPAAAVETEPTKPRPAPPQPKPAPSVPKPAAPKPSVPKPTPPAARGRLVLSSAPSGLTVRFKGRRLGRTPVDVSMPTGEHEVLLRSRRRGISRRLSVTIRPGESTTSHLEVQKGGVQVVTRPWAEVFLDGQPLGKTPLRVEAYEGRHELRLVSRDGAERIQVLQVEPGENPPVRIRF